MLVSAKLNLGLKILSKREDGYHDLESYFVKITWGDEMEFEATQDDQFHLESDNQIIFEKRLAYDLVSERGELKKNILFKTFEISKSNYPQFSGVKVKILKRIPPGSGLGGGSSNAASLLLYLYQNSEIFNSDLMLNMGRQIGADVPFFLMEGNAFVSGIGEKIQPVSIANGLGILALVPQFMDTKEAYMGLKKPLQTKQFLKHSSIFSDEILSSLKSGDWGSLYGILENDFEWFVFEKYPELKELKIEFMNSGALFSSLTGSGACVFGLVGSLDDQFELLSKMQRKFQRLEFVSFHF